MGASSSIAHQICAPHDIINTPTINIHRTTHRAPDEELRPLNSDGGASLFSEILGAFPDFSLLFERYVNINLLISSKTAQTVFLQYLQYKFPTSFRMLESSLRDESVLQMSVSAALLRFPWFLNSTHYNHWLRATFDLPTGSFDSDDEFMVEFFSTIPNITEMEYEQLRITLTDALGGQPQCCCSLANERWFQTLVLYIEYCPLGAYITLPSMVHKHPVVYSNSGVRELMGYSTAELLGSPCPCFESCHSAGPDDALAKALSSSMPFKLTRTCTAKGGRAVSSVLLSKPLFDMRNAHRFNVTFQIDESDPRCSALTLVMSQFLCTMPNIV